MLLKNFLIIVSLLECEKSINALDERKRMSIRASPRTENNDGYFD